MLRIIAILGAILLVMAGQGEASNETKPVAPKAGIWFARRLPTSIFMAGEAERDGVPLLDYGGSGCRG